MTKPLYFYNGTTFEQVGPTTPQSPIVYQTSAPTGPATGDLWIDSDGDVDTYNRQLTRYYFVATAAQTTISGVDANSLTLAYVAGSEAVYVNGALQVRSQDYTATNGTSVVMSTALAVNDVVEIFAYTAFTVANAYTKSETDGIAAAAAGLRMVVPTSVAVGSGSGSANANGFVTFSGASSLSLNGVFSSTYDNYLIMCEFTASGGISLSARMRLAGTDASTATYTRQGLIGDTTSALATQTINATSSLLAFGSTARNNFKFELFSPALAQRTTGIVYNAEQAPALRINTFYHDVATAYDGITFITSAGTFSGTIGVYGYKD